MTRWIILVSGSILVLSLGIWWGLSLRRAQNGQPSISTQPVIASHIVGSTACRECHRDIAEKYDTSGHAHTFHSTVNFKPAQQLAGQTAYDSQRQQTFHYQYDAEGLTTTLPSVFGNDPFPLTYALGSGTHATTFLTLLPHKDGGTVGVEHRFSFYRQLPGLGLTVGHPYLKSPVEDAEYFGKVLDPLKLENCISCHTTQATIQKHELVNVIPHVGCESCHGPGSQHVQAQRRGEKSTDYHTAVRFPTALDELRACGRCHRLPESLKPSELVRNSLVLPRFQPAGLMQSRCYTESQGAMRCSTCHDPHSKTSTDAAHYNRICQECHQQHTVVPCPQETSNCTTCHMPKIDFEGVAAFHDHWIRVRNDQDPPPVTEK